MEELDRRASEAVALGTHGRVAIWDKSAMWAMAQIFWYLKIALNYANLCTCYDLFQSISHQGYQQYLKKLSLACIKLFYAWQPD